LESLEEEEEDSVQTMLNLSQQEYVKHIDNLHQQLIQAWDSDQRVKSLKISIQVGIFFFLQVLISRKEINTEEKERLIKGKF